ncbi:MAG TPA: hypothetical protein VMW72_01360 [Sedimentisphaerales bacterium]|nr:hypothetical protein [Sedimentisphaerales bacterium]
MAENKTNIKLDTLPEQIRDSIKDFADQLTAKLGENLQSITVVGSSLTGDFRPGQSDINTVLVLRRQTLTSLNAIAALARPMRKKRISPPLLMTESYIEQSRDVFGVELLDFQLTHQTILGDDPFAALAFDKKDVRLQCERELKAMLIRLRQGYIAAAANKKLVRDVLISTTKGLMPFLRAMLWLKDIDRHTKAEPTLLEAVKQFLINKDSLITTRKWQHQKVRLSGFELEGAFESIYATVEQLALFVDKLEV